MCLRPAPATKIRAAAYPVLLIAILAATAGARYADPAASSTGTTFSAGTVNGAGNEVYLPIEIMGPEGTIRSVSIHVDNAAGVDSMYLVGHSLGYQNSPRLWNGTIARDSKASYRVNGGAWLPISNDAANVRFPEREYMGIGGAYHTVRLTVPLSGVQSGLNTVDFRFNGTEGAASGFRILEIDMRAGTQSRIGATTFVQDDPSSWTAPAGADPLNGRTVWERRNSLIESPLPGAPIIVASCSDCHAYSGFDLKYFNFSNESIVARAQFHGLTEQEGRDVAAYIRHVDLGRTDGLPTSPYARPWNPPYQPGPGLTDRGEQDWAAGAGLQWVLDSDDESAYYLFPDASGNVPNANPSGTDMARTLRIGSWDVTEGGAPGSHGNRLDIQNAPIAIQYPDWNHWLPDIHPLDGYGYSDLTSTDVWNAHLEMYDRFDTPQKVAQAIAADRYNLTCTESCPGSGFHDILRRVNAYPDEAQFLQMYDIDYATDPSRYHLGRLSLAQWQSVKTWEIMNRFRLQDVGDEMFGGLTTPAPWIHAGNPLRVTGSRPEQDAPFFWPGAQNVVFGMAPHSNSRCASDCNGQGFPEEGPYGPYGTLILSSYFSSAWYDLQLVLSQELTGLPNSTGGGPVDWPYITGLARSLQNDSEVSQWWRMFRIRTIAGQSRHNWYAQATTTYQYAFNGGPAFTKTVANFWEVVGWFARPNGHGTNVHAGDIAFTRRALREYWNEWFTFARTVPLEAWVRGPADSQFLQTPDVTPQPWGGEGMYFWDYWDADNAYRLPPLMLAWGMDTAAVDNVARWGETMWPNGNWEQWFIVAGGGDAPGTGSEPALLRVGQTTPNPFSSSVTLPYELSRPAQVQVQVYDAIGRLVATVVDEHQEAGTYAPVFESGNLPGGLYLCRVQADDATMTRTMVLAR